MGWTIVIEDENGSAKKTMPEEFILLNDDLLNSEKFRVLKYLDPYGDTTFNAFMFEDLIKDLKDLIKLIPAAKKQIEVIISYAKECDGEIHTYLKFYGD